MFFIGIFGVEDKEKEIKEFNSTVCPCCGKLSKAVLAEQYTYFHIFFLPVIKWNRRCFLKYRCCGAVYEAEAGYAKELKNSSVIDSSRIKKIYCYNEQYYETSIKCQNCGSVFDKSFPYCPYCGTKA